MATPTAGPTGTGSQGHPHPRRWSRWPASPWAPTWPWCRSPPDENMGDAVRLLYLHVPVVTMAYVGLRPDHRGQRHVPVEEVGLVGRHRRRLRPSSALVFTALTLVIGMIWGRPTWGVFWVWDARLTSTAMLALLLLGYLAVRRLPGRPADAGPGARPSSACCCCPTSSSSTGR